MDGSMDNANPTVLDPSDLPSRLATGATQARKDGGTGLFDHVLSSANAFGQRDPFSEYLTSDSESASSQDDEDDNVREVIDAQEIYDLIANITDPEHPIALGALSVVNLADISVTPPAASSKSQISTVTVLITPTITHCSLATVIGLAVRVRLEQSLPPRFRVDVRIKEGTHSTDAAVSKQLGDKERVAAALENGTLMGVLKRMLSTCT